VIQPFGRLRAPLKGEPHRLLGYAVRRILAGFVTLFVVSIVVFMTTSLLPGDAAVAALGKGAQPELVKTVRHELGLDKPPVQRYADWLKGVAHGDFGKSILTDTPVRDLIGDRIVNSVILALVAGLLLIPLSLFLGATTAARADGLVDRSVMSSTLVAISLPEFVIGTILILLFAQKLHLLPPVSLYDVGVNPLSQPTKLVLPVLTLIAGSMAQTIRLVRAGVIEVSRSEYVQMARLKGVSGARLMRRHILRNALVPAIQVFALALQWMVGAIVVTELVFAYPGVGTALVQAVGARDLPVVQALALFISAVYITLNVVADLLVVFLTPRLRTG
jgi:peptide/nickel transport system permease protein